jgi:mono/diheme cytochrome c family protein
MSRLLWLFWIPALLGAVDDNLARGAAVYRASCSVAYCHGPEGKPGRAPGLAGHGLTARAIVGIATTGIPNTSMPAFGGRLKAEDLEAVAAYIVSLGGEAAVPRETNTGTAMPAALEQGRALFFDAARTGACGSCHEVKDRGIPVSIALSDLRKARLIDPLKIATPDVVTVRPPGENPFPALVAEKTASRLRVYDLSSRLPVLRTFAPEAVTVTAAASWSHSDPTGLYTSAELTAILQYLRWPAGPLTERRRSGSTLVQKLWVCACCCVGGVG